MKIELSTNNGATYTDISQYIAHESPKWDINSVDADGAGRSLDGIMHRIQIGNKDKYSIQCIPMGTVALNGLLEILKSEWLLVRITTNTGTVIKTMYSGATKSATLYWDAGGTGEHELWKGFSFTLIER